MPPRSWVLIVIALTVSTAAFAQESDEDRRTAARLFAEGQKAYREGDFRHAAESFEGAYKAAPRLPPLWNAARAWDKGGESVHAANLYASYLRKAPPQAPDRNSATRALRDLEAKLSKLEIHAAEFSDLKVDGVAFSLDGQNASAAIVYVSPGTHVIEGTKAGKVVVEKPVSNGGTTMSVVLLADQTVPPPQLPAPVVVEPKHAGWSPIVVIVGGAATVIAGGFLIGSGADTLSQRSTFDANPTQANLETGKSDQTRTNVLIGVTAGLGVLTGLAAIFLVDWKGHKNESARLRLGPGGVLFEGSF